MGGPKAQPEGPRSALPATNAAGTLKGGERRRRQLFRPAARYPLTMSSAEGWDLTVPEDAAELLAELRRHGVRPGQRLHVVQAAEEATPPTEVSTDRSSGRKLDFIGSVHGGPDDLSARTDEYLQRGFGRE